MGSDAPVGRPKRKASAVISHRLLRLWKALPKHEDEDDASSEDEEEPC